MTTTLVTATADRPEAFKLLELFISRQTVKPDAWQVYDDGNVPVVPTMGQHYVYCPECRQGTSMINKLKLAFTPGVIKTDIAILVEDDDHLDPAWIETCVKNLSDGKCDIFGEGRAVYYNVRDRWWYEHGNMSHASLCSTALTNRLFPLVLRLCNDPNPFLDDRLWKSAPSNRKRILDPYSNGKKRLVVGIKAMPGKAGYGGGHKKLDPNARQDPEGTKLIELIGTDCSLYDEFWTGYVKPVNLRVPVHTETGRVRGPNWMQWLSHLVGQPNVVGMEVGTFRGESAEFFMENIFFHETAKFYCVDFFGGSPEHHVAKIDCTTLESDTRARLARFPQVEIIKSYSQRVLRSFGGSLNFLYVDASHTARDVLRDAVLGFDLLDVGGTMIFDDFEWTAFPDPLDCPKLGIQSFLNAYARQIEVLQPTGWQIAVRKKCE